MPDVVVVGDLLVDVVVHSDGPLSPGSDTPAHIWFSGGGSAANTASWLARLGRSVRLVAAVGDDAMGRHALAELAAQGVTFAGAIDPARSTGTCVALVDSSGERTMLPDRGANDGLSSATVEAACSDRPEWLHLSGYTLLHSGSRPAGLAALDRARHHGTPVSIDPSSAAPLRAVGPGEFLEWIDGCELMLSNEAELAALGGVEAVLRRVAAVLTKRGGRGAMWTDGSGTEVAPAVPVEIVDSIGAGDAFAAGFLDAHLAKALPRDSLVRGCEIAAQAVTQIGGRR